MNRVSIASLVIVTTLFTVTFDGYAQKGATDQAQKDIHYEMGYYEDLAKALQNKDNVRHLNLMNRHLTKVPNEVFTFQNLEILDLSHNEITAVPEKISKLSKLNALYINHNQIKEVPESLKDMTNLETLFIQSNPVNNDSLLTKNLPAGLKKLEMGNPAPGDVKPAPKMSESLEIK